MIEFGKLSPVGTVCEGNVVIKLEHMMSPENYKLLVALFNGEDVFYHREPRYPFC